MRPSASEVAASDAGPLLALGVPDRLDLLPGRPFRRVLVGEVQAAAGRYLAPATVVAALAAAGEQQP